MEKKVEDLSSAEAVLYGALAPGVNAPTWNTLKMVFVMLGVSLMLMLTLAFTSSDSSLIFHVAFLVILALSLFCLLSGEIPIQPLGQFGFIEFTSQHIYAPVNEVLSHVQTIDCLVRKQNCLLTISLSMSCELQDGAAAIPSKLSFLEQTGLVSVEHQMQEMGLIAKSDKETNSKME